MALVARRSGCCRTAWQNFHASLGAGLLIAFHTHVGGVVAFMTVDDNGLGVGTDLLDGPLAAL